MFNITSCFIKTNITCAKCYQNVILAGIGGNVHVFKRNGELLQVCKVFEGQNIHGIVPNRTNKLILFGSNQLKIVEYDRIENKITSDIFQRNCSDWIFTIEWLDSDTRLAIIYANNYMELLCVEKLELIEIVRCEEKCILYSASTVNSNWNDLYVFSGTVFGQVLIWRPSDHVRGNAFVIWRLEGHDGAIFSINYNKPLNIIASTSDDRTVRIWTTSKNIFDDNHSKDTKTKKITLKCTLYGHLARVFRSIIVEHYVITAGEDGIIHIWTVHGEFVRKFETHQNGCVWALDYSPEDNLIVTGGSDCGISLYPLYLTNESIDLMIDDDVNEIPRSLKFTAQNNVVLVLDSGLIKYYDTKKCVWSNICLIEDLKSYAILEVSESRELIGFANLFGTVHIYKEQNETLRKLYTFTLKNAGRIFSLHWLTSNQLLTSTVNGLMNLWCLEENNNQFSVFMKSEFVLPQCKERWATCAICFETNYLAVGDRKGNIHLYQLNCANAVQTIRKAHCHLGVTSLRFIDKQLISLGRNGMLNKFNFHPISKQLTRISSNKLPFSWLATIFIQENTAFLLGFSGSNFVVYNLNNRRIVLNRNCGGGHRSWHVQLTNSNQFDFLYIKEKRLHLFRTNLNEISVRDLIPGFHTKEIDSAILLRFNLNENQLIIMSGGEDTTIRLNLMDLNSNKTDLRLISTLKSHLSSVRCLTEYRLNNDCYLVFSGGGRAHIILWKLQIHYAPEHQFERIECQQLDSYYKTLDENESETRVMDLVAFDLNTELILLIAACSDGTLRCYQIRKELESESKLKLKSLSNVSDKLKCIIKIAYFEICDSKIIISMATDGKLTFWDFTKFCSVPELKPFYSLPTHKSGVNSFSIKFLTNNRCLIATGGDDNAIILNLLQFKRNESSIIIIEPINKWINSKIHGAQITGVFISDDYLITASIDQYISVFKYRLNNDVLECVWLREFCSAISDIQGMKCFVTNQNLYAFVHGNGVELCKLFKC